MATASACVSRVRTIIESGSSLKLSDKEVMKVALGSALRTPSDVIGFMYQRGIVRQLLELPSLSISEDELLVLLQNIRSLNINAAAYEELRQRTHVQVQVESIAASLRSTLQEEQPAALWRCPAVQIAAVVAMDVQCTEKALETLLGCLLRSDTRRIDDLRGEGERYGVDTITQCGIIDMIVSTLFV